MNDLGIGSKSIDTSGYTRKTKEDLMQKVRDSISDAYEGISKE